MKAVSKHIEDGTLIFEEYAEDINHKDTNGDNLLLKYFKSTAKVDPAIVKHICTRPEFKIDSENNQGLTPMLIAATYALPLQVFETMIVDGRANVNYINRNGCSVIYLYCQFNKILDPSVLKLFLRHGFWPGHLPDEEFMRIAEPICEVILEQK